MWWFAVYNEYDQGIYSRNVASLSGEVLADTSDLAASGNPGIGYEKLNLHDRSTLFAPDRFSSPERTLPKNISISTLVKLHLLSSGDVGYIICGGKQIVSGQNLQA